VVTINYKLQKKLKNKNQHFKQPNENLAKQGDNLIIDKICEL
jgi:hypothetical protein